MRPLAALLAMSLLVLPGCQRQAAEPVVVVAPPPTDQPPAARGGVAGGSVAATALPPRDGRRAEGENLAFEDETSRAGMAGVNIPFLLAMGLAAFDMDGDGDLDLLVPTGLSLDAYRNDGGFHFTPTPDIGFPHDLEAYATALGDCDGDGDLDVVVTSRADLHFFRNLGNGTFIDASREAGFGPRKNQDGSLVFFDADGDGDLDLFIACYAPDKSAEGFFGCNDALFINDGACHFHDEAQERGIVDKGFGVAVAVFDPDRNGYPDLMVVNDFGMLAEGNRAWINDGTGHFTDKADDLGLGLKTYGMSASLGDLNGDGNLDLYVSDICESALLLGAPDRPFLPAAAALGVLNGWVDDPGGVAARPVLDPQSFGYAQFMEWSKLYQSHRPENDPSADCLSSWASPIVDLDSDGHAELFVVSGMVGTWMEATQQRDSLFWAPDGKFPFQDVGADAGLADLGSGRGAVVADMDGDGKLDILVGDVWTTFDPSPMVHAYRNVTANKRVGHHLFVDLRGKGANTAALGALVEVWTDGRKQVAYRSFGTSTLGSSAAPLHFGLGASTRADEVVVHWPWGGGMTRLDGVPAGHILVNQGQHSYSP